MGTGTDSVVIPKIGEVHRGVIGMADGKPVYEEAVVKQVRKLQRRPELRPMYKITLDNGKSFFHLD